MQTREAIFKHIGPVQLPDLVLEVGAATHFSEALLVRRPSSSDELLAVYVALLAHGTDLDAKGVGSMIPSIDAAHIATSDAGCGAERRAAPGQRTGVGVPERHPDRGAVGCGGTATKGSAT